jgi:hypothetical protein
MTTFVNVLGWTGAVAILMAYWLATSGRAQSSICAFRWINLYGAAGLMAVSVYYNVFPNVFLDGVWAVIGVAVTCCIWIQLRERLRRPEPIPPCPTCGLAHRPNGIGHPDTPVDRW